MSLLKSSKKNIDTSITEGLPTTTLSEAAIEAMIDRAAKRGAREALQEIGLQDDDACHDVRELRSILQAFRLVKRTVCQTMIRVITAAILMALMAAVALALKFKQ